MSTRLMNLLSLSLAAACVVAGCGMPPPATADSEHRASEEEEPEPMDGEEGEDEGAGEGAAAGVAEPPAPRPMMTEDEVNEQLEAWSHCGDEEQSRLCVMRIRGAEAEEICEGETLCERRNMNRQQARESLAAYEQARQREADHPNPDARPKLSAEELEQRQNEKKQCGFDNACHRQKLADEADEICGDDFDCHERNIGRDRARSDAP